MRWVTVATEEGPRACGVVNGQYVDVNAADPEMPSTRPRAAGARDQNGSAGRGPPCPEAIVRHDPANVDAAGAGARPAERSSASG